MGEVVSAYESVVPYGSLYGYGSVVVRQGESFSFNVTGSNWFTAKIKFSASGSNSSETIYLTVTRDGAKVGTFAVTCDGNWTADSKIPGKTGTYTVTVTSGPGARSVSCMVYWPNKNVCILGSRFSIPFLKISLWYIMF